jgi:hypothetical protein
MSEPKIVTFQTHQQILEHIARRETEAGLLPLGPIKQAALIEIAKLRVEANSLKLAEAGIPARESPPSPEGI